MQIIPIQVLLLFTDEFSNNRGGTSVDAHMELDWLIYRKEAFVWALFSSGDYTPAMMLIKGSGVFRMFPLKTVKIKPFFSLTNRCDLFKCGFEWTCAYLIPCTLWILVRVQWRYYSLEHFSLKSN